ncbi:MaoC family dehydratase [Nocardioides marmoribigeumensis]|uniref:2-methylfumaryl-CoA hydratase n=1 Tax=Nocardioides marmoribigeumensis TaxID=433649 RepID=A0ABU2BXC6_9ACTN|nr:MaoC family dehydratase [Nocardioides marmoribigeumensis]MDR7363047.1 2-methylfumaryl-CoA hydratase [Nocardioides marmoribigeumensis]
MTNRKTDAGNYFEDFTVGQELVHTSPRTVTEGDAALYTALYGARFAPTSGATTAEALGYDRQPMDSLLVFHVVFGKTVPEVSLNAVANLGYAAGTFQAPVYAGDTLSARSEVIGVKANRDGRTGVVYVHSVGRNQRDEVVLDYVRWVMVRKRDEASPAPETVVPELPKAVPADQLTVPFGEGSFDTTLSGSPHLWDDYEPGERIDHVDAMTIEEAEHMLATRLYHNTAKVHFNQHVEQHGRFGRRIVYGGHVISIARALSFNGLANAVSIAAINGGSHTNPTFAGDTVYAWSEVLDKLEVPGRTDVGALRVRTVATKDRACADFPYKGEDGKHLPEVVLDFDYTVLVPRR